MYPLYQKTCWLNVTDLLDIKYVCCDENKGEGVEIIDNLLLSICRSICMIKSVEIFE